MACEMGRLKEAETIFKGVSEISEDTNGQLVAGLGMAATKISNGDFDDGIDILSEKLEMMDDDNMEALTLLAYAMIRSGRDQEANELLSKLKENPNFKGSLAQEVLRSMEV